MIQSYKKFIAENTLQKLTKKMSSMTPAEFLKYDWRMKKFIEKYEKNDVFTLIDGTKTTFIFDPLVLQQFKSGNAKTMSNIRLQSTDGRNYKLSDLGKTKEDFGGRGAGSGTAKEDMALRDLLQQMEKIKVQTDSDTVKIKVGRQVYEVFSFVSTPGTPKSDFHAVDEKGNELFWISHKDGKNPRDFQQWGGISKKSEPKIHNHPEVQLFVADLKREYPQGLPKATTLYRKIKDNRLKMMSVYGNEYGGSTSRQNVSVMLQGPIGLKKQSGDIYQFTSNHVHYNGESVDSGGFEPVLTAIYKGDRSDAGVKGTRIVIMPIQGRKMSGEI